MTLLKRAIIKAMEGVIQNYNFGGYTT